METEYEGVPRNKISWHPIIDYQKCVSCGKCVDFCHSNAFGVKEEKGKKRAIIRDIDACVVFCRGCEDICPAGAISHPSVEKTQESIDKFKVESKAD